MKTGDPRRRAVFRLPALLMMGVLLLTTAVADAENGDGFTVAPVEVTDPFSDAADFFEEEAAAPVYHVPDPLNKWNRAVTVFNDRCYFWLLKPVARGYQAVVPTPAREGVRNFFHNVSMPVRFVNCLLQGKMRQAAGELGRFGLNTTVGVLGFGNPARKHPALNPDAEDMGQTLGRYGIGNGIYIVWPVLGPSTLRDTFGLAGDWLLQPVTYVEPSLAAYGIKGTVRVNDLSLRIGEYEAIKEAAIDPYTAFRDVYLQYRREKVKK